MLTLMSQFFLYITAKEVLKKILNSVIYEFITNFVLKQNLTPRQLVAMLFMNHHRNRERGEEEKKRQKKKKKKKQRNRTCFYKVFTTSSFYTVFIFVFLLKYLNTQ